MIKRLLFLLWGVLAVGLAAELGLRALPVSTATHTGYHLAPNILTYPPHHRWTVATGWDLRNVQHLRSNNMGFAAAHDFVPGSDAVGLVGDSYVEASMLPLQDRPAAQLERALGGRLVYALGGPGSSLLDYAERMAWAQRTLGLNTFVVLMEHVDASQTLCGSDNTHAHCLLPGTLAPVVSRRPPAGPVKALLRESALAQYLNSQLKFSPARLKSPDFWRSGTPEEAPRPSAQPVATQPPPLAPATAALIDASVDIFFKRLQALKDVTVVFVIDMNRRNLEPGVLQADQSLHVTRRLRERQQRVVQGEPLYREHLRQSPLRLDVGPHDGHLNRIGVALLMQAAAQVMQPHSVNGKGN